MSLILPLHSLKSCSRSQRQLNSLWKCDLDSLLSYLKRTAELGVQVQRMPNITIVPSSGEKPL